VKIELLYFDGCPNHEAFLPHLRELLSRERITDEVRLRRVESSEDAERERFLGSPTLRIDGRDVDPGAAERGDFGLKCRLYRTDSGVSGVPHDDWIVQALRAVPDEDQRPPRDAERGAPRFSPLDLAFWASDRLGALGAGERSVHRRILRQLASGRSVTDEQLAEWAAAEGLDADEVATTLEEHDLAHRDRERGGIGIAYPFSAKPTAHRVRLAGGAEVFAMCALDALGIAFMTDQATQVSSSDSVSGEPIEISVDPAGSSHWRPQGAVVVVACAGSGPSAAWLCPNTNFAASTAEGRAALDAVAGASGMLLSLPDAIEAGGSIFGSMLAPEAVDAEADRG